MLNTYFLSLFSTNFTRYMFKSFGCRRAIIMNFFNSPVSFSGQAQILRGSINNDQH